LAAVSKSPHLPFHVSGVLELGRVMRAALARIASSCFARIGNRAAHMALIYANAFAD